MPAQVTILRHAEKLKSGNELSERGWERAYALTAFIRKNPYISRYGDPFAIFATKPHRNHSSIRMKQTMIPLSQELRIPVRADYERSEFARILDEIHHNRKYSGKSVVICWQGETIPDLARSLGYKKAPKSFDGYDHAWILRYQGNRVIEFKDIPQRLLAGDRRNLQ